jgi:redox-regulated HSP33 family molecular chaperone
VTGKGVLWEGFKLYSPQQVQFGCTCKKDLSGGVVLGAYKYNMTYIFFLTRQTGTEWRGLSFNLE